MGKIPVSTSIETLKYSVIREMLGLAVGLDDVVNLSIGEPDFDTPTSIIESAFQDARRGHTHYSPSQGDPELLAKLSDKISKTTHHQVKTSSILITHGGMGALTAALRTFIEPGDEVILIEPHFPDYIAHITLARGTVVRIPTHIENSFIPRPEDIENAVTAKSRVLIINSPNNPTGAVLPKDILHSIANIAIDKNLLVISDEVYDRIIFDGSHHSIYNIQGMADRTLVVKSFSKSHAMTGWRIGYCYGAQRLIQEMLKVVNYSTSCSSTIGQRAAIAALDLDDNIIDGFRDIFLKRVNYVSSRLDGMGGVNLAKPKGSIYVFADISQIMKDSRKFAIELLQKEKVVVVPGYAFGTSAEGCIRIACTQNLQTLEKGMNRFETFIENHLP